MIDIPIDGYGSRTFRVFSGFVSSWIFLLPPQKIRSTNLQKPENTKDTKLQTRRTALPKPLDKFLDPNFNLRLRIVAQHCAGFGDVGKRLRHVAGL